MCTKMGHKALFGGKCTNIWGSSGFSNNMIYISIGG